jgi:hypothetical protein
MHYTEWRRRVSGWEPDSSKTPLRTTMRGDDDEVLISEAVKIATLEIELKYHKLIIKVMAWLGGAALLSKPELWLKFVGEVLK